MPLGGFEKGLNVDVSGFAGLPGLPIGGGVPLGGGWGGVPYVPVTPLGALGGVKGDLIVPIVAVGIAIFILIIIVLAVKAALAWKVGLIADKKFRRDLNDAAAKGAPPQEDYLNQLSSMVLTAIQSQNCAQNMICQIGTYARKQDGLPALIRIMENWLPKTLQDPISILRSSAEGSFDCDQQYKCGNNSTVPSQPPKSSQNDQKKPIELNSINTK